MAKVGRPSGTRASVAQKAAAQRNIYRAGILNTGRRQLWRKLQVPLK